MANKGKIDIVKIDNSFNKNHVFSSLNAIEQNVAYSIFSKFSNLSTTNATIIDELTIDAREIKRLSEINKKSRLTLVEYRELLEKLRIFFLSSFFIVHVMENEQIIEKGTPIFHHFDIINNGESVRVKLMPEATHLFSQIFEGLGFSIFALKSMVSIPSPTAKNLYRLFLDGKHVFGWKASREELFNEFEFKKNTAFSSFIRRLDSYLGEVYATGDFEVLKYKLIRDKYQRGRPIVQVDFEIKIKSNRLEKLVRNKKASPNKRPTFYDLKIAKDSVAGEEIYTDENGIVRGRQRVVKKFSPILCPKCHGEMLAFISQKNKVYACCKNSKFWKLGNNNCDYVVDLEDTERLTDDLKIWVSDQENTIPQKKLLERVRELISESELNAETELKNEPQSEDSPFPDFEPEL